MYYILLSRTIRELHNIMFRHLELFIKYLNSSSISHELSGQKVVWWPDRQQWRPSLWASIKQSWPTRLWARKKWSSLVHCDFITFWKSVQPTPAWRQSPRPWMELLYLTPPQRLLKWRKHLFPNRDNDHKRCHFLYCRLSNNCCFHRRRSTTKHTKHVSQTSTPTNFWIKMN